MSKRKALENYVQVKDRVAQFREDHPDYTLCTELLDHGEDWCLFKALIGDGNRILATGHSKEKVSDNAIVNRTSLFENCETSAVGRALAFLGYKIDGGIASREEMSGVQQVLYTGTDDQRRVLTRTLISVGADQEMGKAIHEGLIRDNISADLESIINYVKDYTK